MPTGGEALADRDWTAAMVPDVRRLAVNTLIAGVAPVVCYGLLRPHLGSDALTLALVMVFPIGEIAFERARSGSFEPIGVISLIGISLGLIGALASGGDAFLLKMRESIVTGVFGVICLASLPAPRPLMFYLGRAFAIEGHPERAPEFEEMWLLPGVPRRFRIVTMVWGAALVGEAAFRTGIALALSTGIFLVVAQVVGAAVIAGLIWFTIVFSRASERRLVAAMAPAAASTAAATATATAPGAAESELHDAAAMPGSAGPS